MILTVGWSEHTININIFVFLFLSPWRWPYEWLEHVAGRYIIKLHSYNTSAFVGLCEKPSESAHPVPFPPCVCAGSYLSQNTIVRFCVFCLCHSKKAPWQYLAMYYCLPRVPYPSEPGWWLAVTRWNILCDVTSILYYTRGVSWLRSWRI
jgi:hypothetical protein